MGYIVRNAHSASIAATLEVNRQNPYSEGISSIFPITRNQCPLISFAMNARTEGMGIRATGRTFGKAHTTIIRWEQRLAEQVEAWSPPAPEKANVTVEGDEVYTCVGENLPPSESEGWTVNFIERESRDWMGAQAGFKDEQLFATSVEQAWEWVKACDSIRWFTDGERRYGQQLWPLASVYLLKAANYASLSTSF